ncbi:hypothetical protein [Ekhidna sp.]|uniref:hypothetical protein n=1 Tax=Ekhidna sp. TaxID=2608089 RepID=UPI003CCC11C7
MKLTAGIVLGLIFYEYYGAGDTINFFEDVKSMKPNNGSEPRTQFFLFILKPVVQFSNGSYWITSLYFSFLSFISFWYGVGLLIRLFPQLKWLIAISFLMIPSIVFWSSGIIKDSLASASLIIFISTSVFFYHKHKINIVGLFLMVISAFVLLKIKHYILISGILFIAILFCLTLFKQMGLKWKVASIVIFMGALSLTQIIHPYLKLDRIPWTLHQNNQAILDKSDVEDQLNIELTESSWNEVLKNVPKALHAGLFRPSIMDKTPIWGWIHRGENIVLTTLIMMSIILAIKLKPTVDWPLLLASICCILLLAIMLPLSTPNFGTLVRYKNAYMPYLFLISSILPYRYLTSQTKE